MTAFSHNVGDIVRRPTWPTGYGVEVLYVGRQEFFARDPEGDEASYTTDGEWTLVPLRVVLELRTPRKGDRYLQVNMDDVELKASHDHSATQWVIVEGDWS